MTIGDPESEIGEGFYVGHLLDGAQLSRRDRAMIKSAAHNSEALEDITSAMIDMAPELDGSTNCPIGQAEPDREPDDHLVQLTKPDGATLSQTSRFNRFRRGRGRGVLHADALDGQDEASESVAGTDLPEDIIQMLNGSNMGEESCDDGECPPELVKAENDAFAMHFKAKQKIMEIKKLRNYYQKPQSKEERAKEIQNRMKEEPCNKCGQLGHWSRECPSKQKVNAANVVQTPPPSAPHQVAVTWTPPKPDEETAWSTLALLQELQQEAIQKAEYRASGSGPGRKVRPAARPR